MKNGHDINFDYKNVSLLKTYTNPHARMFNRRRTELPAHKQRQLARAVKRARQMALMPFIAR